MNITAKTKSSIFKILKTKQFNIALEVEKDKYMGDIKFSLQLKGSTQVVVFEFQAYKYALPNQKYIFNQKLYEKEFLKVLYRDLDLIKVELEMPNCYLN